MNTESSAMPTGASVKRPALRDSCRLRVATLKATPLRLVPVSSVVSTQVVGGDVCGQVWAWATAVTGASARLVAATPATARRPMVAGAWVPTAKRRRAPG
jgi:hypothetical protein